MGRRGEAGAAGAGPQLSDRAGEGKHCYSVIIPPHSNTATVVLWRRTGTDTEGTSTKHVLDVLCFS